MRIGDCNVDLDKREITADGQPVALSPRAWDVLGHLVRNRGMLVTTADLLASYWGGRTGDETYVRKQISEIRRVLGDSARTPRLVKTVSKRGYVLLGEPDVGPLTPEPATLAVLPFVNFSPDADLAQFCDGLTEELLNKLARRTDTAVVARTSAFQFKDRSLDVREIGRALDASHVLEGSVRKGRGLLRVTAQLIDARTGLHCWSDVFECGDADDLAAQDAIAAAVSINVSNLLGGSTGPPTRTIFLSDRFQDAGDFKRLVRGLETDAGDPPQRS
jgi:TolB-like protein